jgi:hypothetical protein
MSMTSDGVAAIAQEQFSEFIRRLNSTSDAELRRPRTKPRVRVKAGSRYFRPGFPSPKPAYQFYRENYGGEP